MRCLALLLIIAGGNPAIAYAEGNLVFVAHIFPGFHGDRAPQPRLLNVFDDGRVHLMYLPSRTEAKRGHKLPLCGFGIYRSLTAFQYEALTSEHADVTIAPSEVVSWVSAAESDVWQYEVVDQRGRHMTTWCLYYFKQSDHPELGEIRLVGSQSSINTVRPIGEGHKSILESLWNLISRAEQANPESRNLEVLETPPDDR